MLLHMYKTACKVYIASQTNIKSWISSCVPLTLPHLPHIALDHCIVITPLLSLHLVLLFSHLSRVVILNPPLAIRIHEARTAAIALRATATTHTTPPISAQRATKTKQDRRDEEACERRPREAHHVPANACLEPGRAECVAAFDNPGAVKY